MREDEFMVDRVGFVEVKDLLGYVEVLLEQRLIRWSGAAYLGLGVREGQTTKEMTELLLRAGGEKWEHLVWGGLVRLEARGLVVQEGKRGQRVWRLRGLG